MLNIKRISFVIACLCGMSLCMHGANYTELLSLAEKAEQSGQFQQSLVYYTSALAETGGNSGDEAFCEHRIGRCYMNLGNPDLCRQHTKKALALREKIGGKTSVPYLNSLNNIALSYFFEQNYTQAVVHGEQVVALGRKSGASGADMGMWLINLGRYYYKSGRDVDAVNLWEEALPMVKGDEPSYEFLLNSLGLHYQEKGDFTNAKRILDLSQEYNAEQMKKDCATPKCMLERAQYHASRGENDDAKNWFRQLFALPLSDEENINACEAYASYIGMQQKDFATASDYMLQALRSAEKSAIGHSRLANLRFRAGLYSYLAKKYDQAVSLYDLAIDYYNKSDDADKEERLAACHKNAANALRAVKNYDEALTHTQEVLGYVSKAVPGSADHAAALLDMANTYKWLHRYDESYPFYAQSIAIYKALGDDDRTQQAVDSYKLCCAYAHTKPDEDVIGGVDGKEARDKKMRTIIDEETAQLELVKSFFGDYEYAMSLGTIAGCYSLIGNIDDTSNAFARLMDALPPAMKSEFLTKNAQERQLLWANFRTLFGDIFSNVKNDDGDINNVPDEFLRAYYNALLLDKGMLLNSAIEFSKVVDQASPEIKQLYDLTVKNEKEIDNLRQDACDDDDVAEILAKIRENEQLQHQLYSKCAEVADYTDYLGYTIDNVAKALRNGDVAVEFYVDTYDLFDADNYVYALVLPYGATVPKLVKVCDVKTLKDLAATEDYFNDASMGDAFWKPIVAAIGQAKNVYFSPSGKLNQMAIEYMLMGSGERISDRYNLFRVSSTKELCREPMKGDMRYATLIGGIDFADDSGIDVALNDFLGQKEMKSADAAYMGIGDSGMLDDLPQTRRSLREIYPLLSTKGYVVDVLYGAIPTRNAFLNLSSKSLDMMYIATHGLVDAGVSEETAMEHCRLALAGANMHIDDLGSGDGFVTAKDIAGMNLRSCHLAVLSACDTGSGAIGDDGVFGLQRGFKNAGVRALMMSLKPVDADLTMEMMTNFFRHFSGGKSMQDSFNSARKELALAHPGSTDWASFILLDAF